MSLNNNTGFYQCKFNKFNLVVDANTSYFNATKLCKQRNRQFRYLLNNNRTKTVVASHFGTANLAAVTYEIKNKSISVQFHGMYVHRDLLEYVIEWMCAKPKLLDLSGSLCIVTNKYLEAKSVYMIISTTNIEKLLNKLNYPLIHEFYDLYFCKCVHKVHKAKKIEKMVHLSLTEHRVRDTNFFEVDFYYLQSILSEMVEDEIDIVN